MHSFLLIGQSNMAGRGYLNEAHEIDTSRIYTLRNGRWQKMFRPINPDRSTSGVSLAESFAEAYAQKHNVDVGLICCADGGTTLEQWMPGSLLYDHAVYQANLAGRTAEIKGVLWHQGESDCSDNRYHTYKSNLSKMLGCLRKDLNIENVPILLGGLGDYLADCPRPTWELCNYTVINEALQYVADTCKMTGFVSAKGLQSNSDLLHFNAESLYEFGLRYFAESEKLRIEDNPICENTVAEDLRRSSMELL